MKKNETVNKELKRIRDFIKYKLKTTGHTYEDLARKTGLSPLKVRRLMSNQDIKLHDLILISKALGFSLMQTPIFENPERSDLQVYTLEQEQLLCEYPEAGLFFLKLRYGYSIEEAAEEAQISKKNIFKVLRALEEVKLLQLLPESQTIIRTIKPSLFLIDGPLWRIQMPLFISGIFEHLQKNHLHMFTKPGFDKCPLFVPFEIYLSEELAQDFSREIYQVIRKYRLISASLDRRLGDLKPVSGLLAVDFFDAWKNVYNQLIEAKRKN